MSLDAVAEGIRFDPPPRGGVEINLSKGVRDPTLGVEPLLPPSSPGNSHPEGHCGFRILATNFLFVSLSNYGSISHRLGDIGDYSCT
jgi:hypothetical protein